MMMSPATNVLTDNILRYPDTVRSRRLIEHAWRHAATMYGFDEFDVDTASKDQNRRRYDVVTGSFGVPIYPTEAFLFRYEHAGCESPRADVEAIAIAKRSLDMMGIKRGSYIIRVNDAKILEILLSLYLGLDTVQTTLMAKLLAQKRTIKPDTFRDRAVSIIGSERASEVLQGLSKLLTAKSAEELPEVIRSDDTYKNLVALYDRLGTLGIEDIVLDITLAHPEYSDGIVFDFTEKDNVYSTLLYKGGRYLNNDLQSSVGGQGDMSGIMELLSRKKSGSDLESQTQIYLVTVGDVLDVAEHIAEELRSEGVYVEVDYTNRSIDKQIKEVVKKRIRYIMTIDNESIEKKLYHLQDTKRQIETNVSFERVVASVSDSRQNYSDDDEAFDLSDIL